MGLWTKIENRWHLFKLLVQHNFKFSVIYSCDVYNLVESIVLNMISININIQLRIQISF